MNVTYSSSLLGTETPLAPDMKGRAIMSVVGHKDATST